MTAFEQEQADRNFRFALALQSMQESRGRMAAILAGSRAERTQTPGIRTRVHPRRDYALRERNLFIKPTLRERARRWLRRVTFGVL